MLYNYLNEPEGELERKPPNRSKAKSDEKDKGELENGDEEPRLSASTWQVINAMEEAFRNDNYLLLKLQGQALKLIRFYFHSRMLHDLTAEDVVNKVITLLLTGKRKWYPDKVQSITELMFMAVHSFVRNERKKKKPIVLGIEIYNNAGELMETDLVDLQRAYLREDITNTEVSMELENNILALFKQLENDTIAYFVLEELLNIDHSELKKPEAYIAGKLQLSKPEVKNAIRRIRRRVSKITENR